jgi:hypothetical protein
MKTDPMKSKWGEQPMKSSASSVGVSTVICRHTRPHEPIGHFELYEVFCSQVEYLQRVTQFAAISNPKELQELHCIRTSDNEIQIDPNAPIKALFSSKQPLLVKGTWDQYTKAVQEYKQQSLFHQYAASLEGFGPFDLIPGYCVVDVMFTSLCTIAN